jgi:hypothetical protein
LVASFFVSCASIENSQLIENLDYSFNDIKKITIMTIGGSSREDRQGREIYSRYFLREYLNPIPRQKNGNIFKEDVFGSDEDPSFIKKNERLYATVMILGDRRPYDIRVIVHVEKKVENEYVESEQDVLLAKKIIDEISFHLTESLEKRNVIDDFRAF